MDTRIYLSKQAKDNPQETLETLQKAAVDVFSESETNLTELQKKTWFKRLFELLTFSRNNEKALAKSVASLAALQEIVVKALLVLSVQNTELSGDVLDLAEGYKLLSEQINRMAQTQYKLANRLIEWEYGAKRELLISELKEHKQAVVFGVYTAFVNSNRHQASKNGKDFTAALCKAFGTNTPEERDVTYIDKLSFDEQELLFKLLQSWIYLCTEEFGANDIFDRFAISNKRKQELCERIRAAVDMQGADNYIDWYANQEALFEDDINEIDDTEIEFADKDITKRYIDFDDEKIRAVIAQYEACFGTDKLDIYNPDNYVEIAKRIQKVNPAISREAVVGIYNCGGDVLLTTHAMYADNKKFEYSLFTENNLALAATGGEKYRLMLPEWDGINSTLEIDADMPALKEMLLSLAKLRTASTDEAVPFDKLSPDLRKAYYKLLLFIISDSQLPVFDTYARIAELEKEQEKNEFEEICASGIILPDDTAEYRTAVADFFENVPYPSRQIISRWALTTALEILSLTKWSNAVSNREEGLVFCMDYAGVQNDGKEKYRMLEGTTLEPYFIDERLSGEKQTYFFNHSTLLKNPIWSTFAAFLSLGGSALIQKIKADNMRRELINAHLNAYADIENALFNGERTLAGVTENESEAYNRRVNYLKGKM